MKQLGGVRAPSPAWGEGRGQRRSWAGYEPGASQPISQLQVFSC